MRLQILHALRRRGPMNVNEISRHLGLPQSTVATNVQALETAGLIRTELVKAAKGQQKVCSVRFDEIVIRLDGAPEQQQDDLIEVAMPLGLYTACQVSAPCGLCSPDGIIGLLDVPDHFLDPSRMQASLIWFGRGHVEYKFPNNAKILNGSRRKRIALGSGTTVQEVNRLLKNFQQAEAMIKRFSQAGGRKAGRNLPFFR